jgi:LmbE family N-acetylglucosaminyl deacetylase
VERNVKAAEALDAARSLAFATPEQRLGDGGLVVVAPHPDDESLACGGLIAETRAQGRLVRVVIVSDGTGSHPASKAYPKARLRDLRENEARAAVKELGLDPVDDLVFLRLPDRFVPSECPKAVKAVGRIVESVRQVGAQALFVSWRDDPHCDHQASYRIARAVQRQVPSLRLYEYSVWGSALPAATPVEPVNDGFRIRIEQRLTRKRRAIAAHRSQTTDLIKDDPTGFHLTDSDLARFDLPYESFFESVG